VSPEDRRAREEGSAPVEFILVSILVIVLFLGVVQLALTLHVRNMMASAASEGARVAAANDSGLQDGVDRTQWLLGESLGGMSPEITADDITIDGAPAVRIEVTAPIPLVGLWGAGEIEASGRAFKEGDRD